MKVQLTHAVYTDIGSRSVNEDRCGVCEVDGNFCYVVCDGLGGHGMGDAAAQLVTDTFLTGFPQTDRPSVFLKNAFPAAQENLLAEQIRYHAQKKMKTTAAVLVTDKKFAYIGHIGDSRVYVFDKDGVRFRTFDHSVPQMLVLTGEIEERQIRHHPDRDLLLRVFGIQWEDTPYELEEPVLLSRCRAFLICTDGFWEGIHEKEMCSLLRETDSARDWLDAMAAVVCQSGKGSNRDNSSAIAVRVQKKRRFFV